MKKQIFTILLLLFTSSLLLFSKKKEDVQQKTDRMEQREKTTELNYFVNPRYKGKMNPFMTEDGCYVWNTELLVDEYFIINDSFVHLQKLYYRNGQLKEKSVYSLFSKVSTEIYDEEGHLINRTLFESPVKDKLIDGMDYETFFEKEGWYNRTTGESVFRHSPLKKGELSDEVFRHVICGPVKDDPTKMYVVFSGIVTDIPEKVLDKYGTTGENGIKYLGELQDGNPEVSYLFDIPTGKYEVSCVYIIEEE